MVDNRLTPTGSTGRLGGDGEVCCLLVPRGPVVDNTDVVFDRVVTNVGDAYDPDTGKFAAPRADPLTHFSDPLTQISR